MTDLAKLRILVIDDETTQRMLVKDYLEEAGHVVRQAEDGRRGLKMAEVTKPDVILLDVLLPGIDGYSVCKKFKEQPETAETPVILFTASREADVIERGLAAGADDFVTKPVDWDFLCDRVENVVKKARERTDMSRQIRDRAAFAARHSAAIEAGLRDAEIEEITRDAAARIATADAGAAAERERLEAEHADAMLRAREDAGKAHSAEIAAIRARHGQEIDALRARHEIDIAGARAGIEREIEAALQSAHLELAIAESRRVSEIAALREAAEFAEADSRFAAAEADAAKRSGSAQAAWSMMQRSAQAQSEFANAIAASSDRKVIERNARAIAAMAAKLRIVAEAMSKPAARPAKSVKLASLVSEVSAQAEGVAKSRRVDLACRVDDGDFELAVEAEKLRYAILSLIGNGLRFTPAGGAVTLSLSRGRDGGARIEVADTGVGVAPAKLDELRGCLDAAHRADDADCGFGLGVPAAAALARQMGGRLELESSVGAGMRAALVFPRSVEEGFAPARRAG